MPATSPYRGIVHAICQSPRRGRTALLAFGSLLAASGISTGLFALVTHDRGFAFAWGGIIGLVTGYSIAKWDSDRRRAILPPWAPFLLSRAQKRGLRL